jgi:hypothetical protein
MFDLVLDANTIGMIAGLICLLGFVPYVHSVLKSGKKPNRASWWIWTISGILLAISYYSIGGHTTIWVPLTITIGPLTIALISLKHGEGGWSTFDKLCITAAILSLVAWFLVGPQFTLYINLIIDFIGALPTIRKAYKDPKSEGVTAWFIFLVGDIVNLFAIQTWTFDIYSYPVYLVLLCTVMVALILRRNFMKIKKTH